jgi:hypothetical protein
MTRRILALAGLLAATAFAQNDVILRAMNDEMERSRALRVEGLEKPYYIEYALDDATSFSASASLGALIATSSSHARLPRIQVRVGDYQFDNTDYIGSDFYSGTRYDNEAFPIDDSYPVLRRQLWLATDVAYKAAIEAYSRKKAALRDVTRTENLPDFDKAEPRQLLLPIARTAVDPDAWSAAVRRLSAVFLDYPAVQQSSVDFSGGTSIEYLVTSEGTRIRVPDPLLAVLVRAGAQSPDGMLLHDAVHFQSLDPDRMPPATEMERGTRQLARELTALVQAPLAEAYNGPVLFEGMASAQLFAEVLGKNLAPVRKPVMPGGGPAPVLSSELEGRLGARILPEWMDVVDDPGQTEWRGQPLFGHYEADMEGVAPKPLTLVEKGILKNFLLTRQPAVKGFDASNGHARLPGAFGAKAVGLGNLFVHASQTLPPDELKKKLIEMCTQRGKPYGIVVRKMDFPSSAPMWEVRRLLTATMQSGAGRPVSMPLLVYRVYPDGREELVRGLRFRDLTAHSFKDILAAGDDPYIFDFLDNAAPFALIGGSNYVSQTSVAAPSILIDDLEMERPREDTPKPPLVPAPPLAASRQPEERMASPSLP